MSKGDAALAPPPRWARYFVRSGWAHLLLLTGTCLFLFPFLWMIVTSLKTDEELQGSGWWSGIPLMREASPYARPPVALHPPSYVSDEEWAAGLPELKRVADTAVAKALAGNELTRNDSALRASAASFIIDQAAPRLAKSDWTLNAADLSAAFVKLLSPALVAAAIDDRLASIDLLGVQIRTLDASIYNIFSAADIAARWKVDSPHAQLRLRGETSYLHYNFDAPAGPIILRADFDFPAKPSQLHKLILTLRPDNSWHRLDATLDIAGRRFVSQRPTYLAQHRTISVIFQPPSFDDTTLQAKTWVPLKEISSPDLKLEAPNKSQISNPNSLTPATLTLTLTSSSTLDAIWSKALRNYSRAFHAVPFWRYLGNSLLLVALTTIGTLFASSFVAYAFARLHWPGRGVALVILLATMMLPAQVTMIPSFLIWRQLGWYNTLNPLWVPAFTGGAFFIFLMTQHMKTIPRELEESACIDGLNAVQMWYYIILPQVKPAAAAIAIMTFMWSWNEFLGPLIYLRDQTRFPLSLGLFAMRLENYGDWSMIMAANVLMTLPVIVIFFLCQRYFIQGMTMSGLK